jgi:hypothetical protein
MNIEKLNGRVKASILFVTAISILAPISYMLWFWIINDSSISTKAEVWGQFGDFVGGVLNPLIAFSAFYWLATSVLLQKTELAATRDALLGARIAQEEQAKTVLTSTKLQYINIRLEAISSQLISNRAYINELIHQGQIHGTMYTVTTKTGATEHLKNILPELNREIDLLVFQRDKLIEQAYSIAPELA